MAGASVTVDSREIDAGLRALLMAGQHLQPVLRDIGELLLISHRDRFEREVSPDGEHWDLLTIKYVQEKEYNYDKILVLDGYLMDGLHYNPPTDDTLEFGSNEVYAATHQFGRPDAGIVARPFLGVSLSDEAEILAAVYGYLQGAV